MLTLKLCLSLVSWWVDVLGPHFVDNTVHISLEIYISIRADEWVCPLSVYCIYAGSYAQWIYSGIFPSGGGVLKKKANNK